MAEWRSLSRFPVTDLTLGVVKEGKVLTCYQLNSEIRSNC
jgi:hypothetical protein